MPHKILVTVVIENEKGGDLRKNQMYLFFEILCLNFLSCSPRSLGEIATELTADDEPECRYLAAVSSRSTKDSSTYTSPLLCLQGKYFYL